MTLPPGRPPFGGQGSLCASSLHAASYTLLPLRGISPRESMSLDSRLASLPYESSSFATLKGKQGIVPLPPAPLETESTKHRFPLRPLEGERATKWRGGAVRQEPQMTLPPGRPPFGGQGSLCASSLHAASYTLLPLRGISPQGETRDCAAEPCAHLRGRRVGMGGKDFGL